MTPRFQTFAAIRYGYGLSPDVAAPDSVQEMLTLLAGPDEMATRFPIAHFPQRAEQERVLGELRKARRKKRPGAEAANRKAHKAARKELGRELVQTLLRPAKARDAFRERLVRFWADHFTVSARSKGLRFVTTAYIEDAIRPNITGNFRDLLRAVELHPAMLVYLDQILSIGPNSQIGKRAGRGLNENLAREILELHTLGVGGAYGQTDVRQFAELLTGLNYNFRTGFKFRAKAAEPGAEILLGQSYGGGKPRLSDITSALDALALHPDTAHHLAHKLVVHFISDTPDEALVKAIAAAYLAHDGDLMVAYTTMLEHPAAWLNFGEKAKRPFDFMASSLRAMGIPAARLQALKPQQVKLYLAAPMQTMGQPYQLAPGPNGWPEAFDQWITPQGLAARIEWALILTSAFGGTLDPRAFVRTALADAADDRMEYLVAIAESKSEGLALVLASPDFNRR